MKLAKRLVRTAYLRLHGRTIVYDGVILRFPPNVGDDLLWSLCRYSTQGFEPDTWATLRALLADAGTFLDIGSHIGMYSVLARSIVPHADIIAFEPFPALCKRHRLFCKANDATVELHQLALSDVNRTVPLYLAEEASEPTTATIASTSWQARKTRNEISVPAMTVDTFLAERELKMPLVIKIDVEDHEAAVLRGAAKTITCYQPMIVCEILPRPLRDPNNPSDNRPIAAPGMSRFVPH
jgi:FkbM family methyltransferase